MLQSPLVRRIIDAEFASQAGRTNRRTVVTMAVIAGFAVPGIPDVLNNGIRALDNLPLEHLTVSLNLTVAFFGIAGVGLLSTFGIFVALLLRDRVESRRAERQQVVLIREKTSRRRRKKR